MDAIKVICDETNNPPEEIARNRLHATIQIDIGALTHRLTKTLDKERLKAMTEIKCLICGKVLVPVQAEYPPREFWRQEFDTATVNELVSGTNKYVFGMCQECAAAKKDAGLLVYNGDVRDDIEAALW